MALVVVVVQDFACVCDVRKIIKHNIINMGG